jgi:transcriptional regulator with XRE-family HTH domain
MKSNLKKTGEKIRALREDAGLSQEALAHEAGVSWSTIQAVEAGNRKPIKVTLNAIAKALGVKPGELE